MDKLNRIRQKLDKQLFPEKEKLTTTKWKFIADTLRMMAKMIEEQGYYPSITFKEALKAWLSRFVELEFGGDK